MCETLLRDHCLCHSMLTFSWTLMSDCDWEIVFNDCNIVIRQESDTLFDEVAQEERQVHPHFHNEDVTICILTERGGQ